MRDELSDDTSCCSMKESSGFSPVDADSSVHLRRRGRKNMPDSLISMDAPTQPRNYVLPSTTSRKGAPVYFSRPRTSSPLSEEDDELLEERMEPSASEQEKIEWKRRQNTLAARRSRMRKTLNLQRLEERVEQLTKERETWKTRALTLKQILQSHSIPCPELHD